MRVLRLSRQNTTQAKITKLNVIVHVEEYITWFKISVENDMWFVWSRCVTFL